MVNIEFFVNVVNYFNFDHNFVSNKAVICKAFSAIQNKYVSKYGLTSIALGLLRMSLDC